EMRPLAAGPFGLSRRAEGPCCPYPLRGDGEHMTPELLLASAVRQWVDEVLPGDDAAARAATGLAVGVYEGGASVAEACEQARQFIGSWSRHPSHQPIHRELRQA